MGQIPQHALWHWSSTIGIVGCLWLSTAGHGADGAQFVRFYGYDDCIQLSNQDTEVILCPAAGGRILKYALRGKNVLYLPPGDEGWTTEEKSRRGRMNAGRFDIGPEQIVPKRPTLWEGQWSGEILGDRRARMVSQVDEGPRVSLVRTFELAADSSELKCTQTIISASVTPVEYCHWSRTFANGKGICVVPVSQPSRFQAGFVRYDPPGKMLNMNPQDAHVEQVADFLIVSDHPENPKLGFDSMSGWLAYHSPQNLLFVKKFPTYRDRVYNEVAGLTISIWYPEGDMVELEPIGPRERLEKPGQSASFTETWYLLNHEFPGIDRIDPQRVATIVNTL